MQGPLYKVIKLYFIPCSDNQIYGGHTAALIMHSRINTVKEWHLYACTVSSMETGVCYL